MNGYSYTFTGLQPATQYQFRVRQNCEAEELGFSEWTMGSFTTDSLPCFAPTNLTPVPGGTTVDFTWTPGSSETQWMVKVVCEAADYADSVEVSNTPAAHFEGLSNDVSYVYTAWVKALCGNGLEISDWSEPVTFSTIACETPTNVTVTDITTVGATIRWEGNAPRYEVVYGEDDFGASSPVTRDTVSTTEYTITTRSAGQGTGVRIQALCGENWVSTQTSCYNFTTAGGEGIADVTNGLSFSIYPNPANGLTTISLTGVEGEVELMVIDMSGRKVMTQTVECQSADCQTRVDVADLAAGAYFVKVGSVVKKLIVK